MIKELNRGLDKITAPAKSLGIDIWGVDSGLVNKYGQASLQTIFIPRHTFRPICPTSRKHKSTQTLFEQTGNEISTINTLFQLMAIQSQYPQYLTETTDILMTPNVLMHALSGVKLNEFTIASTSQLVNKNKQWDNDIQLTLFDQTPPFATIETPHQIVGTLKDHPTIQMALVPGHDTACVLSALPIQRPNAIIISIGTWGLIGKEIKAPITTMEAFQQRFTNEGTSEGQYRFQKNAMGFWILQKCREEWRQQGLHFTYEQEILPKQQAKSFDTFIDPDDDLFFNPISMLQAIKQNCIQTNQQVPITPGEYILQLDDHDPPSHIVVLALHKKKEQIREVFVKKLNYTKFADPEELAKHARYSLREKFLVADLGITVCNFGVAESGSICLVTNEGNARLVTTIPKTQITVMGMERLVPTFEDLDVMVSLLTRASVGQRITRSYVTLLTGPKKQKEVDGPEELHVVIVDNGRSKILGTDFQEILQCIRCGACLPMCPVYRHIGGHAYGSIYPGPVGAVLTPLLDGYEDHKELPYTPALCGACTDVCPVKIPLHSLLLKHRQKIVETGGKVPISERLMMKAFDLGASTNSVYTGGSKWQELVSKCY